MSSNSGPVPQTPIPRNRERAIAAFIGAQIGEPAWCISAAEIREFVAKSPIYPPLLAALKECENV